MTVSVWWWAMLLEDVKYSIDVKDQHTLGS